MSCIRAFNRQQIQSVLHENDNFRRETHAEAHKENALLKAKLTEVIAKEKTATDNFAQFKRECDIRVQQLASEQKSLNDTIQQKNISFRSLQKRFEESNERVLALEKESADKEIERQMLDSRIDDLNAKIRRLESNDTPDLVALKQQTSLLKIQLREQLDRNAQCEANIEGLQREFAEIDQLLFDDGKGVL